MAAKPTNPIPSAPPLSELTGSQVQWIGGGYAMTFASLFGQTSFIALFNVQLRTTFNLSHGEFGFLYTVATLASSVLLIWGGGLADRIAPRRLGLICLAGLAAVCTGMAMSSSIIWLALMLFGLRFLGQGMVGHIVITAISRWFFRFRGRALSFSLLGYSTGEAMMPFLVTLAIATYDWRLVWVAASVFLIAVLMPIMGFLWRDPPDGEKARARGAINPDADYAAQNTGAIWTRSAVLRDPIFYALLPGFMVTPAVATLTMFHQAHLVSTKGWDLTFFTAFFSVWSGAALVMSLTIGNLIDRYGAFRLLPFLLLPLGLAMGVIWITDSPYSVFIIMALIGMTAGMMGPTGGALWAELYGTTHIGAIRAMATSALVLASAIGPGIAGALIDMGIPLVDQAIYYCLLCFGIAGFVFAMQPKLIARQKSLAQS